MRCCWSWAAFSQGGSCVRFGWGSVFGLAQGYLVRVGRGSGVYIPQRLAGRVRFWFCLVSVWKRAFAAMDTRSLNKGRSWKPRPGGLFV